MKNSFLEKFESVIFLLGTQVQVQFDSYVVLNFQLNFLLSTKSLSCMPIQVGFLPCFYACSTQVLSLF